VKTGNTEPLTVTTNDERKTTDNNTYTLGHNTTKPKQT